MDVYPRYRYPAPPMLCLLASVLFNQAISFRTLAGQISQGISGLKVLGEIPVSVDGNRGVIFTPNHYCRPGFGAWWMALAISAHFPFDIHWVMASQWLDLRPIRRWTVTPATRIIFPRIARVLDFTCFPPMPPSPEHQENRVQAVRSLSRYARTAAFPAIGLAPEGMDAPGGGLMLPYPGVGRLMTYLCSLGLMIQPVGVYEQDMCLVLNFGRPYRLELDLPISGKETDVRAGRRVMEEIASLLPESMRCIVPPPN